MTPSKNTIYCGGNLEVVKSWPSNSISALVTDPPYGLGFMGKDWDTFKQENVNLPKTTKLTYKTDYKNGIPIKRKNPEMVTRDSGARRAGSYDLSRNPEFQQWFTVWAKAMLRITKPGGFLLCFGGTRTYHRLACAIEDAGWEIRDCMMWLYGSGFPKSHNISKAIDKASGAKRKVVGSGRSGKAETHKSSYQMSQQKDNTFGGKFDITAPTSNLAQLWDGYGTALKPAWEPIIVAMKPLDGTFAHNAEAHGVAGLNIDGGRISTDDKWEASGKQSAKSTTLQGGVDGSLNISVSSTHPQGRWPANLVLDEEAAAMLDEQTQNVGSTKPHKVKSNVEKYEGYGSITHKSGEVVNFNEPNAKGASRFFKQIEFTIEDLIWNNTFVNYAEELLWTIEATIESIVPSNVWDWHKELKDLNAQFVEKKLGLCEIYTALVLAGIKNLGSNQEALQAIQDSIGNYNECILILNLVLSVVNQENTDIIQTTINLLKSCGYVRPAIKKCTQKTSQSEPSRFKYVPKTSRRERNMGMENCDDKLLARSGGAQGAENRGEKEYLQKHIGLNRVAVVKNNHPTVKPLALMKYLCTLLKMPSTDQVILDPFLGSGTTGMACKELGINFIGIEKELEYCEIAVKRIAAVPGKEITLHTETTLPVTTNVVVPKSKPANDEHRQSIINAAVAALRNKRS